MLASPAAVASLDDVVAVALITALTTFDANTYQSMLVRDMAGTN